MALRLWASSAANALKISGTGARVLPLPTPSLDTSPPVASPADVLDIKYVLVFYFLGGSLYILSLLYTYIYDLLTFR
jgi:type III secretory pathway component EscT